MTDSIAPVIGERERRDIESSVARVLRDLGNPDPPLRLPDVRELLKLDLRYYDGTDQGMITEFTHRFRLVTKKKLPGLVRQVREMLAQSKLVAFWVPDDRRVLIDGSVPKAKHRWIEGHEISHSLTPWHQAFLLGDASMTLDPSCHATIEAEANFGAGQLLFMHDRFARDARDMPATFASVQRLADLYANSLTSTLWRLVEQRDPSRPTFGMVSIHPKHPGIGAHNGGEAWKHFIRSAAFRTQFANVTPAEAYAIIDAEANFKIRGPVVSAESVLLDRSGTAWDFIVESFSNSHALLTIGVAARVHPLTK